MSVPTKLVKMLLLWGVLTLTCLSSSKVFATQAIMNPLIEEEHMPQHREILNGHGQGPSEEVDEQEQEPTSEELKAELRVNPTASEVAQLLEEDDFRTTDQASKHPTNMQSQEIVRMDCSKITMQIFQVLLQNPDSVEPEDYSCGLLNLISHFEKSNGRIRALEANLHTATSTIKTLESSLHTEISKTQFLMKELNETVHKETERAIKAENVIARRVLSEKSRVDMIQKNMTESVSSTLDQVREMDGVMKNLEHQWQGMMNKQMSQKEPLSFSPSPQISMAHLQPVNPQQSNINEQEIHKIELKLSNLQEFIHELSSRISQMENGSEEHVNKGITQIFKTYASLAHEIEKESERASGEEASLRSLITTEISALSKSVTGLQERITEEKNRVQIIENRRTADLFEEINRAKSEENRLGLKLKDEMSKAAAAFKRLELHVDTQLNSSKLFEDELKMISDNVTRRTLETELKLTEQIQFERTRALSVENSLKTHLETEVTRAMTAENELVKLTSEERERARLVEQELKVALDVETYRAKGVEFSISSQVTTETERAKHEEFELHEHINANMTRLLTDIIKEFTRAQNAEKELEDKIDSEKSRATTVEQNLQTNINNEMNRAMGREQELFEHMKSQDNSTKVVDQVRNMIETESLRAIQQEANLEGQINAEANRARNSEDKLYNLMNNDILEKFRAVEYNVTATTSEILRHSKELELEVRKTVMAEVARAVDSEAGIKQQLSTEVERALQAELALERSVTSNYSNISTRFQDMSNEIHKDALRLEDISLQISRNLTGDILTLAELFDDKLDDLERNENIRLKKVEEDMKKCCSGSSWRWRSPKGKSASTPSTTQGTAEGVINKIMQVLGSIGEEKKSSGKAATSKSSGSGGATNRSLKSGDDTKEDLYAKYIVPIVEAASIHQNETVSPSPSNYNIVLDDSGESEKVMERVRQHRKKPSSSSVRSNRRVNSNSSSDNFNNNNSSNQVVSVQSVHSKVTNTFG